MSTKRKKTLRYFFYNDELHKKLHINRAEDVITAWNYPQGRVMKYIYSDVRKRGEKAFSTPEVMKLVRRGRGTVLGAVDDGNIPRPQFTYGLDENRNLYKYYWSEKDIMALHAYLKTVHIGRPRHDDKITPGNLPSAAELRAMMKQGTVLYVKTESGEFVPTWQAEKF